MVSPACSISTAILEVECFHAAYAPYPSSPDNVPHDTAQQPMAIDGHAQQGVAVDGRAEQPSASDQPQHAASEHPEAKHALMSVQGMAQTQRLLSCALRMVGCCLRRHPLLLAGQVMRDGLPAICNLAVHGGVQVGVTIVVIINIDTIVMRHYIDTIFMRHMHRHVCRSKVIEISSILRDC